MSKYNNFSLTFDLVRPGGAYNYAFIYFSSQALDINNAYVVSFIPWRPTIHLTKMVNGEAVQDLTDRYYYYGMGSGVTHRMTIRKEDGLIQVYLGEELILSASNDVYGEGYIGFGVGNAGVESYVAAYYDNISITPLVVPAEITVTPQYYDFGNVELGRPSLMSVLVTNSGGEELSVSDIDFQYAIYGDPFTFTSPVLPFIIAPGASVEVWVKYAPSWLYNAQSNTLSINSDDEDEPTVEIDFSGTGTISEEPSSAVASIQVVLESAVRKGLVSGDGPGNSASNKLNAFLDMIESAGDLIDGGQIVDGCEQLWTLYNKSDGQPKPPDFIVGPAVPGIAQGIFETMVNAGCLEVQ